ncbi:condensation domain-containing protein [Actinospica robiniae]|uniref:condensation domain-containing protein n=1 Tax=Actinospica robiniae TaxID=304901 RepID=UPI0004218326|nr:condensation domain-containing protein [Actinospica robiniae]
MTGTARQVSCTFDGGRTGQARATWGQRAIWDAVAALAPQDAARYNVCGGGAVLPGYRVEQLIEAVSLLMLRHESLRTRLAPGAHGELRQTLLGSGELAVTVVTCDAAEEVQQEADALLERLGAEPFDCAADWPIRVGIIESAGMVRHLVFAVPHTAVDGWGLRHLVLDLAELTVKGTQASPVDALQPLDEAEYQATERGQRQDGKARRHWVAKAERGPRTLLAPRADLPADALFPNALLDSPALARAVPLVSTHLATTPATLLLAAAATMIGRLSGSGGVLFQVVVNNRFLPGLKQAVSTVAQEGLFHLDVRDVPFAELVYAAAGASLATYRYAYYDKARLDADLADLNGDLSCFVNDTRGLQPGQESTVAAPPASPDALEELRGQTRLHWPTEFPPRPNVSFALDAVDIPGSLGLTMTADPSRLPRPEMERVLFGMEELILDEALRLPGHD